jgi:hypothetical protein
MQRRRSQQGASLQSKDTILRAGMQPCSSAESQQGRVITLSRQRVLHEVL